mgnify:CR=1 FL=1
MNIIGHDTETELISRTAITPDWICSGFAFLQENGDIETALTSELTEGHQEIHEDLYRGDDIVCYHNFSFDGRVLTRDNQTMMDLTWAKLERGQIKDTMIREKLLNLVEWGNIDLPNDRKALYGQVDLEKKYLSVDRSESKEEGAARTTYCEVRHLPIDDWPIEYSSYAMDDPKYCVQIYMEQELRRKACIQRIGIDPFAQEDFRVMYSFALALMSVEGLPIDKERLEETSELFHGLYKDPRLVEPLANIGLLKKAIPSLPSSRITHVKECIGHNKHPEHIKGYAACSCPVKYMKDHLDDCQPKSRKNGCECPVKMKKPVKEGYSRTKIHQYVWNLARTNKEVEIWLSKSAVELLRDSNELKKVTTVCSNEYVVKQSVIDENDTMPEGWLLKVDKAWMEQFAHMEENMALYAERKKLEKMITSYLPRMFYEDEDGEVVPADQIHADYDCLKRTGRTSSRSSKLYPSWNGQQVDPRIRPCAVALPGHALVSIDYNAMELGTLAQTCINLFGFSILGDVLNAGEDAHGFLGAQIAFALDEEFTECAKYKRKVGECLSHEDNVWSDYRLFKSLKGDKDECTSKDFLPIWKKIYEKKNIPNTWGTFFIHYRTFAKPTGLGYPGGLGPKTFMQFARTAYKVEVTLEIATLLREIWKTTFPELAKYLEFISKESFDQNHESKTETDKDGKKKTRRYYSYDTPLGLHRAKTDFCAAANGTGLQSPSAEGAGLGVIEIQKLCYTTNDSILCRVGQTEPPVRCSLFIHDEILGQFLLDGQETDRVKLMEEIMVRNMETITPDVKAGTEPAMALRWDKRMDPVWDNGKLIPWTAPEDVA